MSPSGTDSDGSDLLRKAQKAFSDFSLKPIRPIAIIFWKFASPKPIRDIESSCTRHKQTIETAALGLSNPSHSYLPSINTDLAHSCRWAEALSKIPKSQSLYNHAIAVIVWGLKSLTVHSLLSGDGRGLLHYNECIDAICNLLSLENGRPKYVRESSLLEAALCDQFDESLRFVMNKKRKDGHGFASKYLVQVADIAYCSDTYPPRYTQALRGRMIALFEDFYDAMDGNERDALDAQLNEKYSLENDANFIECMKSRFTEDSYCLAT